MLTRDMSDNDSLNTSVAKNGTDITATGKTQRTESDLMNFKDMCFNHKSNQRDSN